MLYREGQMAAEMPTAAELHRTALGCEYKQICSLTQSKLNPLACGDISWYSCCTQRLSVADMAC